MLDLHAPAARPPPPARAQSSSRLLHFPSRTKATGDEWTEGPPGLVPPLSAAPLGFVQTTKVRSPEERQQRRSCIKDRRAAVWGRGSGGVDLINTKFPSAPHRHALCLIVLY